MYIVSAQEGYNQMLPDYQWHNDVGWEHLPRFIKRRPDLLRKLENGGHIQSQYVTYKVTGNRLWRKLHNHIPISGYPETVPVIRNRYRARESFNSAPIVWLVILCSVALAMFNVYPFSVPKDFIVSSLQQVQQPTATVPPATTNPPSNTPSNPFPTILIPALPDPEANLKNPSWAQLKTFLLADRTDQLPYVYPTFVCDNFARTLQANAKKAGWRCALVQVKLSGYPDWYKLGIPSNTGHACNAFQTTDKGLVYIDCTRSAGSGPANQDKTVDVRAGNRYAPVSISPSPGWGSWGDMGLIVAIESTQW